MGSPQRGFLADENPAFAGFAVAALVVWKSGMDIRLNLFGKAQVLVDGRATVLATDRRCQLLALLALRRDWVQP